MHQDLVWVSRIMHPLASFLAASAIALADLGALVLMTSRLSRIAPRTQASSMIGTVLVPVVLLVGGVFWLTSQGWCDRRFVWLGLLVAFASFLAAQALRLQVRASRSR
jgi:hypothetical protein